MKYLFSHWQHIKNKIKGRKIILLLDYDGTLCPIKRTPQLAAIPEDIRELLKKISVQDNCKLAIISGRSLSDIKNIVGIPNIIYSGNHGLEIDGPKIRFRGAVPLEYKRILKKIKFGLRKSFSGVKGVILEDKKYSLGIHYRLAPKKAVSAIKSAFYRVAISYLIKGKIRIKYGKKVFEVGPPVEWDKGKAVLWILEKENFFRGDRKALPVYLGDDLTDEDAFCVLKNKGLTVFIGKPKMLSAKYYLKNSSEVKYFLKQIIRILEDASND